MEPKRNRDDAAGDEIGPDSQRLRKEDLPSDAAANSINSATAGAEVADSSLPPAIEDEDDAQALERFQVNHEPCCKLPLDPAICILQKCVSDAIGLLRFGATCGSFRRAMKESGRSDLIQAGTPVLITSFEGGGAWGTEENIETGSFGLHDLMRDKACQCQSDLLRNRTWLGGKDDWLLTSDVEMNLCMDNLITGRVIPLPNWTIDPEVAPRIAGSHEWMPVYITRAVLAQTPRHVSGHMVVLILSCGIILVTRHGDVRWSMLNGAYICRVQFCDVILKGNNLVAISKDGVLFSWDLTGDISKPSRLLMGPAINVRPPAFANYGFYLGLSPEGALLLICVEGSGSRRYFRGLSANDLCNFYPRSILVFEHDAVSMTWSVLENFGGSRSLFLGLGYHFFINVQDLGDRIKENCIYLSDVTGSHYVVFNIGTDRKTTFDPVTLPVVGDPLHRPMWFRPTTLGR